MVSVRQPAGIPLSQMATTADGDRAKTGKFKSRYDRNALYPLVADVCRFVNPDEPEAVSQPAFDGSRAAAGPSERAERSRDLRPAEEAVGRDQADRTRP